MTPFSRRCQILSGLWQHHRKEAALSDFVELNDLGLPLAFSVFEGLVIPSTETFRVINKTWDSFVQLCATSDLESALLSDLRLVLVLSYEVSSQGMTDCDQAMFANWLDSLGPSKAESKLSLIANA